MRCYHNARILLSRVLPNTKEIVAILFDFSFRPVRAVIAGDKNECLFGNAVFVEIFISSFTTSISHLGNFTCSDPSSGDATVTVDSTDFTYGNPEPFCNAVLQVSGNGDARAALHKLS